MNWLVEYMEYKRYVTTFMASALPMLSFQNFQVCEKECPSGEGYWRLTEEEENEVSCRWTAQARTTLLAD